MASPTLNCIHGPVAGRRLELNAEELTVGRAKQNDLEVLEKYTHEKELTDFKSKVIQAEKKLARTERENASTNTPRPAKARLDQAPTSPSASTSSVLQAFPS